MFKQNNPDGSKKEAEKAEVQKDIDFSGYITGFKTAEQLAASIASNTTDIFEQFKSNYSALENQARQVSVLFGGSRAFATDLKRAVADITPEIRALGGSMQDVRDMQIESMKVMNTQIILGKDQATELFAASSLVAGTGENIGKVSADAQRKFVDAGYSISDTGSQLLGIINTARELGVSTVSVYKQIGENIAKLNLFNFEGGVQGMAKMAAEASLLRIDMKTSLGLADKLYDPDQAIKMAATFQRLGTTVTSLLDPYKLMDMARNDPAKLQEEVGKALSQYTYFNEQTKKMEFTDFGRAQIRELSKDMGIPMEQLSQWGLATSDISMKMEKIKFPSEFASEKDRKMISGLAHMATEGEFKGEYVVNIGGKEKLVTQLDVNDRDALTKSTEPAKSAVELQREANGLLANLVNLIASGQGVLGLQAAASPDAQKLAESYAKVQTSVVNGVNQVLLGMGQIKEGPKEGLPDVAGMKNRIKEIEGFATDIFQGLMGGDMASVYKLLQDKGKDAKLGVQDQLNQVGEVINEELNKLGLDEETRKKLEESFNSGISQMKTALGGYIEKGKVAAKKKVKEELDAMGIPEEKQAEYLEKYDKFVEGFGKSIDNLKTKLDGFGTYIEKKFNIDLPSTDETKEKLKQKTNDIVDGVSDAYDNLVNKTKETLSVKPESEKTPPPTRSTGEIKTESTVPVNPPVAEEKTKTEEFHFSREGLTMEEMAVELDNYTKKTFGDNRLYGGKKTETIKAEPPPKKEETIKITEPTFKETEIKEPTFNEVTSEKPNEPEIIKITEPTFTESEIKEPTFKEVTSEKPNESETIKITEPTFKETEIKEPTFKEVTSQKPKETETIKIIESTFKETEIKEPTFNDAALQKSKETKEESPKLEPQRTEGKPESSNLNQININAIPKQIETTPMAEVPEGKTNEGEFITLSENLGEVVTRAIKPQDLTPQFQVFAESYGGKLKEISDKQTSTLTQYASSISQPPTVKEVTTEEPKTSIAPKLSEVSVREIIDMMPKSELSENLISKVLEKKPEIAELKGLEGVEIFQKALAEQLKKDRDDVIESYSAMAKSISEPKGTETDKVSTQLQKETNTHLATLVNYAKAEMEMMGIEKERTPIEKLVSTGIEPYTPESILDKIKSKEGMEKIEKSPEQPITEFKPIIQAPEMTGIEATFKKIEETMANLNSKTFKEVVEIKMPETTGNTETPVELTALTSVVGQSISNTNSLISTLGKSEETKVVESTTTGTPETVEVSPLKSYGEDYLGRIEKQIATIVPLRATAEVVPTLPESPSVAAVEKINEKTTTETLSKSEHKSEVNGNIKFDFNINQSEFMNSLMTATKNTAFVKEMEASLSQLSQDREKILGTAKQRA